MKGNSYSCLDRIWGMPLIFWLIILAIFGTFLIVIALRAGSFRIRFKSRDRELIIEANNEKQRDSKENTEKSSSLPVAK